jgi:hypothetical protein
MAEWGHVPSGSGMGRRGASSRPIPIAAAGTRRGKTAGGSSSGMIGGYAQSLPPAAPVIGSLPAPSFALGMPPLRLPPQSPSESILVRVTWGCTGAISKMRAVFYPRGSTPPACPPPSFFRRE